MKKNPLNIGMNQDALVSVACIILIFYANYNALFDGLFGTKLRLFVLPGALCLGVVAYVLKGIRINEILNFRSLLWSAFIFVILFDNNRDVHGGTFFFTLRVIVALLLILFVNVKTDWMIKIPKYIAIIGFPNIIATLFFFVFRGSYKIMYRVYGYYPTGTQHGAAGYCAGIANHYSQNATYISYAYISIMIMAFTEKDKQKKKKLILLAGISFFGLLLTQKRAHLLFSTIALFITYFILSKGKVISKAIKTVFAGSALLTVFYLLSTLIQPIAHILERFSTAGKDPESMTRFAMWELCLNKFKENPIFGIGWAQFPQIYYENLYLYWYDDKYKFLNAHNVYFQLLCEVGIVGFLLYATIVISSFLSVVILLKKLLKYDSLIPIKYKITLELSVVIQIFYVMYCLTGNGLYDYSFHFYMMSVASGIAVKRKIETLIPLSPKRKRFKFTLS